MAREWAETKGLPLLMKAAEEGDLDATRLLVTLAVPRQKPVSLPEPVPSFRAAIIGLVGCRSHYLPDGRGWPVLCPGFKVKEGCHAA